MGSYSSVYLVHPSASFEVFCEKVSNATDPRKQDVIQACKEATSFEGLAVELSCFQRVAEQIYFRSSLYAHPHEDEVGEFVEGILQEMRCITNIFRIH